MSIAFVSERLELGVNYGAVGGDRFSTKIIVDSLGREQRNINWWLPLGRWQLGEKSLLESEIENIAEVQYLKDFHAARKGSLEGFRFKDWADYKVTNQILGIGDGVKTQWQIIKSYYAGSVKCDRPITKPVPGSVKVFQDDIEILSGWQVNTATGVITFDNPPNSGIIIKINCEFDIPVIFVDDSIGWRLEGYSSQTGEAIYKLESVFVEEIRVDINWAIQPLEEIVEPLDLGIFEETIETIKFDTSKNILVSGWQRTDSNRQIPFSTFNLGQRILDQQEIDIIKGYFYCAKGKGLSFPYELPTGEIVTVRFATDELSFQFSAKDENDALFNCSSLSLISVYQRGVRIEIEGTSVAGDGFKTPQYNSIVAYTDYSGIFDLDEYSLDASTLCSLTIGCGADNPGFDNQLFYQLKLYKNGIFLTHFGTVGWYDFPELPEIVVIEKYNG